MHKVCALVIVMSACLCTSYGQVAGIRHESAVITPVTGHVVAVQGYESKFKVGLQFDLRRNVAIGNKYSLQPGLRVTRFSSTLLSADLHERTTVSFVMIPVLLGYRVGSRLNLAIGPEAGVLIQADIRDSRGLRRQYDPPPGLQYFILLEGGYALGDGVILSAAMHFGLQPAQLEHKNHGFGVKMSYRLCTPHLCSQEKKSGII